MPEYMENLPKGADLDMMFRDLYGKAAVLLGDIEDAAGIKHDQGEGRVPVYGTDLELSRSRLALGDDERVTTHVFASLGGGLRKLVTVSSLHFDAEEKPPEPILVEANRGTETISDYLIERSRKDQITVRLDDNQNVRPAEPIGNTTYGPKARLAKLDDIDRLRAQTVANGILDNIGAARLILDGASTVEAFEAVTVNAQILE